MADQTFQSIQTASAASVLTITLNKPPLNILDISMIEEICAALRQAEPDPAIGIILFRGAGPKGFSAGVSVQDHTPERVGELIPKFDDIFRLLAATDKVTVAGVHGFCLGGGFELAAMCDLVVATENATFGQPEIKLGQLAPVGVILLPHLVGYRKAAELVFTGATIGARPAEALGLVNQVVPNDQLEQAIQNLLGQLSTQSRAILRHTKSFLRRASGLEFAQLLRESEELFFNSVARTEDSKEGIYAFLEKRSPRWTHA
ncbi:MAG: enoyl-CoA hydratase/isomerase family protein [Acidobacteria bacterium]|nr:enoyl-CoA hydratase/isomerase family protein [Acidobacteriota bacterium]